MVAKRKSKKNSFIKRSRKLMSNHRIVKKLIAGVFSPVSASRKIQSMSRGRLIRQSQKTQQLQSLLSQGASVYKKALKTLDFRGINMKDQVLSRRVLDGAKFQKVDFTGAKINGAKLNGVNAEGAIFTNTELKKTLANGSSFIKAIFKDSDMGDFKAENSIFTNAKFISINKPSSIIGGKFNFCDLKNCEFNKVNLNLVEFNDVTLNGSTFTNIYYYSTFKIKNSIIDNVTLINSPHIIGLIENPKLDIINGLKILPLNKKVSHICKEQFILNGITFNNLEITDVVYRDKAIFNNCNFVDLKLHYIGDLGDITREVVQFYKASFNKCSFINCDFGKFIGHSSIYRDTTFTNCNLSKCDLRSGDFTNATFINCNMDGVKFVRSKLTGVNFIDGGVLSNIDFQECEGMEGMNFQGLNLQGAKMIGITDPGLNACNFRDANLRGVQFDFSQIHGSDFTGADLTGSNVRVAEGSDQTVGIPADQEEGRAVDTHKTFYNIRINMLIDFYKENADIDEDSIPDNNELLNTFTQMYLTDMVENLDMNETEKSALRDGLNGCFRERLNTYNFSQIIAGTEPSVNFRTLIHYVVEYLKKQPKEFKDIYIQSLILDSTQAYGPRGMSCAAGIVERFVTVMEQAAVVVKDTTPSKAEEYTELINIITNDPKSLIKSYQQEWFEFHKEGGPNAFAESVALDTIMKSYKDFLEEKFDFANLRGSNKEKIRRVIMDDPNAGVNITREYIENFVLFFGGRVKNNRHLNYFKLLKERFYIKDRYPKSQTRKHKLRKNKKRPTRGKKVKRHRK